MSVSPIPAIDILNIRTKAKIEKVTVFDASGKAVNVKLDGDKIDVRSLATGNYLINVETKEGTSTQKFIKK